jgi:NitT/TauT family transport system substrate-binding protein
MQRSVVNPRIWRTIALLAVALAAGMAGGCGSGAGAGGGSADAKKITIAYQPGIGYAELLIMKQQKTLEKALPGTQISWKQLSSGSAIRDGMLSGDIQVGSGGTGPFLVGYDAGVDWKLLSSLNQMDLWLMAKDPKFKSVKDFKGNNRIAMPGPDSIQAIVLKKAAEKELGDPKALDSNVVALAHPDGLQSLLSGQIAGHLTSPPFQFQEEEKGAHKVIGSYDLFGEHTFNSVFVRKGFYDGNKKAMDALYKGIQDAAKMLNDDPKQAAKILSQESGGQESAKNFEKFITKKSVKYATEPKGFMEFAKFMKQVGLLKKVPGSAKDLVYPNITGPVS